MEKWLEESINFIVIYLFHLGFSASSLCLLRTNNNPPVFHYKGNHHCFFFFYFLIFKFIYFHGQWSPIVGDTKAFTGIFKKYFVHCFYFHDIILFQFINFHTDLLKHFTTSNPVSSFPGY